jgi:hypothetical protein
MIVCVCVCVPIRYQVDLAEGPFQPYLSGLPDTERLASGLGILRCQNVKEGEEFQIR